MEEAMFLVALTPDEGSALIQALDLVVRHTGLQNAHAALALVQKINDAHESASTPSKEASDK